MTTTPPSNVVVSNALHELGQLEDAIAAAGWVWDGSLSHQIDRLVVVIEAVRA
jgi:hypothetical protein